MKSFQIFSSVNDSTILAADTSGLLKDAKVKVSFEFVQYLRNGVFVVVEDLPNWVQNTTTGKYTANYLYDDGQPVSLVFYEDAASIYGYSHFTVTRKMWHHKCVFDITEVVRQYDFIYSPNVAASENFDEDKYANTTDVTVWKDLVEDGKIQLSTGSLVRNITLNFCQPFAIGDSGAMLDILRDGLIQKSAKFVRNYIKGLADENIIRDRKSTRLNSSHRSLSRMPSSA